jgi:hypothetical protein
LKKRPTRTHATSAEQTDFLEHLAEAETLAELPTWELLTEERHAVERRRDEKQPELQLPAQMHAVPEDPSDEAAEHQAGRPARMKDVEIVRAVFREERRHERVCDRFERSIGQAEQERADVQEHVGRPLILSRRGAERDQR